MTGRRSRSWSQGLRRLEYRGYDSAGVAVIGADGQLQTAKKAGRIENLDKRAGRARTWPGTPASGTPGGPPTARPNDRNAHPHVDAAGRIAVVHNGIIENFAELRAELEAAGVELRQRDRHRDRRAPGRPPSWRPARRRWPRPLRLVCRRLEGAFTLVAARPRPPRARWSAPGATRRWCSGVGDGENVPRLATWPPSSSYTSDAVELGQDQLVEITRDGYRITDFAGTPVEGKPFTIDWDLAAAEKGGFDYFMLKEIAGAADRGRRHPARRTSWTAGSCWTSSAWTRRCCARSTRCSWSACGTAYHAGLIAKHAIEHWTRIPVEVEMASEFRYRDPVLDQQTLVVAISQSGETADTLEAVRHAKEQKATVLAICNTNGAQIPRESDAVLYTHAGPEIGVAATKTFSPRSPRC